MNERMRKLRREIDLTQQEFADKLGIPRNNIASYETGKRSPSGAVISLICKTFSVNETWLRTGQGDMFNKESREEQLFAWAGTVLGEESDSFRRRFVMMLSQLSEDEWKLLEKMALSLANGEKKDQEA